MHNFSVKQAEDEIRMPKCIHLSSSVALDFWLSSSLALCSCVSVLEEIKSIALQCDVMQLYESKNLRLHNPLVEFYAWGSK